MRTSQPRLCFQRGSPTTLNLDQQHLNICSEATRSPTGSERQTLSAQALNATYVHTTSCYRHEKEGHCDRSAIERLLSYAPSAPKVLLALDAAGESAADQTKQLSLQPEEGLPLVEAL